MVRFITNVQKEFPNMFRIMIYREPRQILVSDNKIKRHESQVSDSYVPSVSSLSRTKATIRDLILANNFELFATFTFDPSKVDRFNYAACYHKISRWIHNQHDKSPDFKYLFIPERHKDGAWHFHALLSNYKGSIRNSHHKSSTGRDIYNITAYRGGYTTACYIDDPEVVSNYVMKYITKDFIKTFNKRRFTASRNLDRPVMTKNVLFDSKLLHRQIASNDSYELIEIPKF